MTGDAISHYRILEKLGEGGMGVVYKARDERLDRPVALKFLPPERVADPDRKRRFIREARAASALNHPNIITIYEIACEGGTDFIVMEYLPGRTLSDVIAGKPLPAKEAIGYAAQIAGALTAAHQAGIIHRDLKPGNIMLTSDGRAKVLDFGLAKLLETGPASEAQTQTLLAGTAAYMAPEQAEGRAVDARSDIYSFGAVLFEMLAGRRAFEGFSREDPAPLAGVSSELQQVVARCLRRNPAERFQTAADLKAALETAACEPQPAPSIAVLPFANLSADKENEYFSDGLAEEIINALTKIPGLRVPARTSSFAFRGKEVDVAEIGVKLKVGHILEGSVRKSGDRIRVTAQLISVADGYHIWSERYDCQIADIFDVQDRIAQAIVAKLSLELGVGQTLINRRTASMEAYSLYLRGRYLWRRATAENWRRAVECFERAIAEDPHYALPYAGLAVAYTYLVIHGWGAARRLMPAARTCALKALALDEELAEAHWAIAYVHEWYEWDWRGAESEFRRALELSPRDGHLRIVFACFLMYMGRGPEAFAEGRQAVDSDPISEEVCRLYGYLFWLNEDWDRALAHARLGLELHPHSSGLHLLLGIAYSFKRELDKALHPLGQAKTFAGEDPMYDWALAFAHASAGRRDDASPVLEELDRRALNGSFSPTWVAALQAACGNLDRAFALLELAIEERDGYLIAINADPVFGPLRSDPRFAALAGRMALPAPVLP